MFSQHVADLNELPAPEAQSQPHQATADGHILQMRAIGLLSPVIQTAPLLGESSKTSDASVISRPVTSGRTCSKLR